MNIKEAKQQIKNAMVAYFTKDEFGSYEISIEKQRPVFLMGPPGIGKTAIMEQIAAEMGVGLLSYSMTHHTRQSALGLPFIEHKVYGGEEFTISEYTMSEIIASVYELMENTGVKEGILFLDEINCVSETLAPVMLQFLQYKIFGKHRVPEGWIVVTAGNPPEYNKSVREFDIVTWDRLKRIDCEPDFDVFKEYAYKAGVHQAVLSYLELKKANFYKIESTENGKSFVTARGWDDLSQMLKLYEKNSIKVDEKLISQYIQNPKIAKDFAVYYDLFMKYKSDYQVDKILDGNVSDKIKKRALLAQFDERLSLIGLILDEISLNMREIIENGDIYKSLSAELKGYNNAISQGKSPLETMNSLINDIYDKLFKGEKSGSLTKSDMRKYKKMALILSELSGYVKAPTDASAVFADIRNDYNKRIAQFNKECNVTSERLNNVFTFFEEVFGEGQEILILVTELTANYYSAKFINIYGCEKYFAHNKDLLFFKRAQEIDSILGKLDI